MKAIYNNDQASGVKTIPVAAEGRYLRIQLAQSPHTYLHLSEVEVFGEFSNQMPVTVATVASPNTTVSEKSTPSLNILKYSVDNVSSDSVEVNWTMNEHSTGQVEFGTTTNFGSSTKGETSLKYEAHRQKLTGLRANTIYLFRILASNKSGENFVSQQYSFKTAAQGNEATTQTATPSATSSSSSTNNIVQKETVTPAAASDSSTARNDEAAEDWPSSSRFYNEDLPMAGIFYGQPAGGTFGAGNGPLTTEVGWRFRAEKTGYIDKVSWQNRTLRQKNIDDRCLGTTNPQRAMWCVCYDNKLTPEQCSYTIANSYSVGNGGKLVPTLYAPKKDDPLQPDESKVLGKMPGYFIPAKNPQDFTTIKLDRAVRVEAGKYYFVVLHNLAPPKTAVRNLSVAAARATDPNVGAISLNGMMYAPSIDEEGKFGPYFTDQVRSIFRSRRSGDFSWTTAQFGWWEVGYTDNTFYGHTWSMTDSLDGSYKAGRGIKLVDGQSQVRQVFTVQDADRHVDGVWIYHTHNRQGISGASMNVVLTDSTGKAIASHTLQPNKPLQQKISTATAKNIYAGAWGYVPFNKTHVMKKGRTYYLTLSAPAGAGFVMQAYQYKYYQRREGVAGDRNRLEWEDAHAEGSTDGGKRWTTFTTSGAKYPERDIPVLFTIEGMPKSLPFE